MIKTYLITGGSGFIGTNLVQFLLKTTPHRILNLDKLTYASHTLSYPTFYAPERYQFIHADIADANTLKQILQQYQPDRIIHLAAETHVDRSIHAPDAFIQTNIIGTYTLLEQSLHYWRQLSPEKQSIFRFVHISTDEVYGDLPLPERDTPASSTFTEHSAYAPSSPYAASKASSDHLVQAWHRTYQLPTLITHCTNNYGPYQYREKLIPHTLECALKQRPIPLYGQGQQMRDWLYVEDHVKAIMAVAEKGHVGETYNIGAQTEKHNHDVVLTLCRLLDTLYPQNAPYESLITFVADRPGHDQRYAIDPTKIRQQIGWLPTEPFQSGIEKTVHWYLQHPEWLNLSTLKAPL